MDLWAVETLLIALFVLLLVWGIVGWNLYKKSLLPQYQREEITGRGLAKQIAGDFVKYCVPLVATMISVFSYGANAATSAAQLALGKELVEQIAELRGELHFRAFVTNKGTLVLESLSDEAFFAKNLYLYASYSPAPARLPQLGSAVPYDPMHDYNKRTHTIEIPNAGEVACRGSDDATCRDRIVRILLDFEAEGERYRVVAPKWLDSE